MALGSLFSTFLETFPTCTHTKDMKMNIYFLVFFFIKLFIPSTILTEFIYKNEVKCNFLILLLKTWMTLTRTDCDCDWYMAFGILYGLHSRADWTLHSTPHSMKKQFLYIFYFIYKFCLESYFVWRLLLMLGWEYGWWNICIYLK